MYKMGIRAHDIGKFDAKTLANEVRIRQFEGVQLVFSKALDKPVDFNQLEQIKEAFKDIDIMMLGAYFNPVHPAVCQSCQLVMGMTVLEPGNVWNTMPCHTHERRMEVYFYFDMQPDTRVFHFMGQPQETRHLVVSNEQAIISPSWSIHSGVATSNYTFIWGMCGENITFDDMDFVDTKDLK